MKKILFIVLVFLGTAQFVDAGKNITKKVEVNGKKTEIKLSFADTIRVETWNNSYVEIQVSVDIDDNRYNDYYSLNVNEKSGKAEIEEKVDFEGIKKEKGNRNLNNFNTDINYHLKVPKDLDFDLSTISGKVELIGCQGEMSINSVSGFIDYSVPENHKANIGLSTVTGDVYSNLNFDNKLPKEISWVGINHELLFNGGDVEVQLKTVSGDIFLRKY
jgi:hypothetical protein